MTEINERIKKLEDKMYNDIHNPFKKIDNNEFEKNIEELWKLRKLRNTNIIKLEN